MTGRLLTAREVGERLGLSTESVLRRWRRGELPGFRLGSNVLRFDEAELDAWLEARRGGDRRSSTAAVVGLAGEGVVSQLGKHTPTTNGGAR